MPVRRCTRKNSKQNFWKLVERAIRIQNRRRCFYTDDMPKWNQKGGDYITFGGHTFQYIPDITDEEVLIRGVRWATNNPCFRLRIETIRAQRIAQLEDLLKDSKCSYNGTATTVDMVHAIIELAKRYGAVGIELSDESGICKKDGISVSLSLYSMITKGKTWYEHHFGFQPVKYEYTNILKSRVAAATWSTVMTSLTPRLQRSMLRDLHANITDIDANAVGSIQKVFERIPYEKRCDFYKKHLEYIADAIGIGSIKGSRWYLPLTPDYVPPSYDDDETTGSYEVTLERNGH